jgi:hypothetical protein
MKRWNHLLLVPVLFVFALLGCGSQEGANVDAGGPGTGTFGKPTPPSGDGTTLVPPPSVPPQQGCVGSECHADGEKSGDETDVDCGGTNPNPCVVGQACQGDADCASSDCVDQVCVASAPADPQAPNDPQAPTGTGIDLSALKLTNLLQSTVNPKVLEISPGKDAKGIGPNPDIWIKFNQPMNEESVRSKRNVAVFALLPIPVSGTVSKGNKLHPNDARYFTFTPAGPLSENADYALNIEAAKGLNGLSMQHRFDSDFCTGKCTQGPPMILEAHPAQSAKVGNSSAEISVRFNRPMDYESLNGHFVVLMHYIEDSYFPVWRTTNVPGVVLSGSQADTADLRSFRFYHIFSLGCVEDYKGYYEIKIEKGTKDQDGNATNLDYISTFCMSSCCTDERDWPAE